MREREVRERAFAMPLTSPAYPIGPYRFVNREYLIITYRTDPVKLRALVPEPLIPDGDTVKYEFIRMPDSTGFGDYTESGQVVPEIDLAAVTASLAAPNFLLKIIPHADGTARICELVEYSLEEITVKGAWTGPAALHLHPHALAPVAELPVLEVISGVHIIADLTLGLGKVAYDYLR
jgi:acetoacetate decarboxylase